MEYAESLQVNILQGEDAINLLKADWIKLLSNISTPSLEQDWRWNAVLVKNIFKSRFSLLSIHAGTEPIALFPLQTKTIKHAGIVFKALSNLSDDRFIDLSDALIHPDWLDKPLLQAIKQYLAKTNIDLLEFSEFTDRSLLSTLSTEGWLAEPARFQNAYAPCTTPEDLKTLSKKHIKNIERLSSKAEMELGEAILEIIIGKDIQPSDMEDLFDIENSGWKAAAGTSILATNTQSFYEEVVSALSDTKDAYVIFLKLGTRRIASALAFKAGARLYIHKIAYRDELKEFGSGNIMLLNLFRAMASSAEVNEVNLVTCPLWCERWHLQTSDRLSLRCLNSNIKGKIFLLLLKIKKILGKKSKTSNNPADAHV
jgi:CelD/BcsL family acetyltransferase involved in cellulose biosynthesis